MAALRDLLRRSADYYDTLPPAAQFATGYIPGVNLIAGLGQIDKYASQGDLGGVGITALSTIFPPLKMGKSAMRGLLHRLSPTGTVANAADTTIELSPEDQAQWNALRAEELRRQGYK